MTNPWDIENDYEIKFRDYATNDYISLGSGDYCSVRFDGVGSPDIRESTIEISGGDGYQFGIEYQNGLTWTITGSIHSGFNKNAPGSPTSAWETWSKLNRAWSGYPERLSTRAVVPLHFKRPGREQMVVYGRPNRIDPDTKQSHAGFISYTATFRQSDPRFYSSTVSSTGIQLETPYAGGIVMDNIGDVGFLLPFQTTQPVAQTGAIVAYGDADTDPIISISGKVTNPRVTYYGPTGQIEWIVRFTRPIPNNTVVTIDTRQWKRTITDQDGKSYAGAYVGKRLQDVKIKPGPGIIEYTGTDYSGASVCNVSFRNAWRST